MFELSVSWWEFVVRGAAVYLFLLFFLRLAGRRQIGQYAAFDLILLLILANAVENAMTAGDNSLIGGLISALTLLGCHVAVSQLTWHWRWLEGVIEGKPEVLIRMGVLDERLMRQERLTIDDVKTALRTAGCLHLHEVERATIETNGHITVVPRNRDSSSAPPVDPNAAAPGGSATP